MKALEIHDFGGPEVMQIVDVPKPELTRGSVLVRVEAAGLNYSDIMIRHNQYLDKVKLPYQMGREYAGIIEAVDEDAQGFEVGQRVVGSCRGGAMAEYVVVPSAGLFSCPDGITPEQAVAMLVQGITAVHCLDDAARVQEGETVLIHAAAGGVGTLAVQLAVIRGAKVIGTASNDEKCELIAELGGTPINYKDTDWVRELHQLTNGRGADVILESVGGDIFLKSFREALAPMGRLVVFGAASGEVAKLANVEILGSGKAVIGYFLPRYFVRSHVHRIQEAAVELVQLIREERLRVIIGKSFALDDAVEAFNFMESRQSMGKVIINP
jgi:NADPH2:quinone reductase